MVEVKHMKNGMDTFTIRIRKRDRCEAYGCKGGALIVKGIAEKDERMYKVVAHCEMCGKMYAFCRVNRRYVDGELLETSL